MATSQAPTVRQRRLGIGLRRLREDQGLTAEEIAERLNWSPSKLSRIENARIGVRVSDVRLLLEIYRTEEAHRGELLALAQVAGQKGWWTRYTELSSDYATFIAFEDDANAILSYQCQVIPGLLQTKEYARAVISAWNSIIPRTPREIDRLVDVRIRRQQLLTAPSRLNLSVILDEAVILRCTGDREIMYSQLMKLVEAARLPNVTIRVIRLSTSGRPTTDSFNLLRFSSTYDVNFPDVVYIESGISAVNTATQDDVATHGCRLAWEQLTMRAVDPTKSEQIIMRTANDVWGVNNST